MGRLRKVCTRSSMSPHSRETWLWRCPPSPWPVPDRRPSGSRCPGHRLPGPRRSAPSRPAGKVRERREVAAAPQLGDSQFDRTRTGLPVPLAVAIALVAPPRTAFAVPGAAQRFTLQLHHALGGKAEHLAQECRVGALLQKRAKGDLVFGHRGDPRVRVACCNPTLLRIAAVAADRPACARLVAVAPAGRSAASYTITRDMTQIFSDPFPPGSEKCSAEQRPSPRTWP